MIHPYVTRAHLRLREDINVVGSARIPMQVQLEAQGSEIVYKFEADRPNFCECCKSDLGSLNFQGEAAGVMHAVRQVRTHFDLPKGSGVVQADVEYSNGLMLVFEDDANWINANNWFIKAMPGLQAESLATGLSKGFEQALDATMAWFRQADMTKVRVS